MARRLLLALIVAAPTVARADREATTAAVLALLRTGVDGDLVMFDPPRREAPPRLVLAARVKASVARMRAALEDPATYRQAIPAFVRADTLQTQPSVGGGAPARLLAWELEIPLWNLEGELWLRPGHEGVTLELISGALAGGRLRVRALSDGDGDGGERCLLVIDGSAPLKDANWVTRRLAARDPLAEPAMAATAAYVLLRGLALHAEQRGAAGRPPRWPRTAMRAPTVDRLEGYALAGRLARVDAAALAPRAALALVRSRPDGRLDHVSLAVRSGYPAPVLQTRLGEPARWQAMAGWKQVQVQAANGMAGQGPARWQVDSSMPFVDFDAEWLVRTRPRFTAAIDRGDWQGAVMAWDLVQLPGSAGEKPGDTVATFSLHPRIETTGYFPRKLIQAEPLLEHGLALGLAYADAVALLRALEK